MVLSVVEKLENFVEKTIEVKNRKKMLNRGVKPPENEFYLVK